MKSGQKKSTYECKGFADDLLTAFAINTSTDIAHMHPDRFCECCHLSMRRIICARAEKVHHKCTLTPFEWEEHRNEGCKVCEHFRVIAKGGNSRKLTVGRGRQPGLTPNMVAAHLWNIAPPPVFSREPYPPLSSQNNTTVLEELKCVVCANVLSQPLELPCGKLACTSCIVERVTASATVCSCCLLDGGLVSTEIRPASNLIQLLLKDVLVQCVVCHRDVKAGYYEDHECTQSLTPGEEREAAGLLKRAISTSPDQATVQLATGGTPMIFMKLTKARHPTTAACSRTVKTRCSEMHTARSVISGGEPSALLESEVLTLNDEEKKSLLEKAGITNVSISPAEVLAIKTGLTIPWNRLRILRRNLKGEMALFSFPSTSGGEELRVAALVYIPDVVLKVVDLLEENQRTGRLTWHDGVIPASEIWLKLGGDKGGGSFKMNFQIVNVAAPNSVHNTCVFCCFEVDDTVTNLHIALDRYKDQVAHLQGMQWRLHITLGIFTKLYGLLEDECHALDLELALLSSEEAHSSFDTYSQELQMLCSLQSELNQAEEAYAVLQQMTTYVSLVIGENDSVTADFFVQCEEKKKYLGKLALDDALQSIGVHRQQYFGGAFVGNHVHQALKECNIQKLCRSLCETAKNKLPHRSTQAEHRTEILVKAFSMFARCHNIYDHNFIDETQAHALEEAVGEFMTFFRESFPQATVPIEMHLLEDHAVPWAKSFHVGFGLLGEQGAESIHAKFTRLSLSYTAITDKVQHLLLKLNAFAYRKKRSKQRARGIPSSQENKAKAPARYKADPEKKKASVRDSYKADPEKKKASVRDSYKADPEKKKASLNGGDGVLHSFCSLSHAWQTETPLPHSVGRYGFDIKIRCGRVLFLCSVGESPDGARLQVAPTETVICALSNPSDCGCDDTYGHMQCHNQTLTND
ncbi:hypothetical protein EMCRGX_G028418 [Ephydatia muelleri]